MKILVATEDEVRLATKYLPGYEIVHMGVGANNVIKTCVGIPAEEKVITVGYCGSNCLKIGQVIEVSKTYRLLDKISGFTFDDYRNGYELSKEGYPCYTNNSFVVQTDIVEPCAFDMELNYIAAFPFQLLGAVKIVSDNLSLQKYEESIKKTEDDVWGEVRRIVDRIAAK